jgi:hypothetical protein
LTVNTNDLLIFKLRQNKTDAKNKKEDNKISSIQTDQQEKHNKIYIPKSESEKIPTDFNFNSFNKLKNESIATEENINQNNLAKKQKAINSKLSNTESIPIDTISNQFKNEESEVIITREKMQQEEKERLQKEAESRMPGYQKAYANYIKTNNIEEVKPPRLNWPFQRNTKSKVQESEIDKKLLSSIHYLGDKPLNDELTSNLKNTNMTKKESIEAAKGLKCISHPWRDAYAICNYCKMPFCYADISEYNNSYYCLQDLSKAEGAFPVNPPETNTSIIKISSIAFIISAFVLLFYIYPQVSFIISKTNIFNISIISNLGFSYGISILNILFIILSFISGILIFVSPVKNTAMVQIIVSIIIITLAYEYLITNISYVIIAEGFFFMTLIILLAGKSLDATIKYTSEIKSSQIKWPRLENF